MFTYIHIIHTHTHIYYDEFPSPSVSEKHKVNDAEISFSLL